MKKIVVIGAGGQLGSYLLNSLKAVENTQIVGLTRKELDLSDISAITEVLSQQAPDMIINSSAYTAVDKAEEEPELAMQINSVAPEAMAEYAKQKDIPLIHYSTDYVFSGDATEPYAPNFTTAPQGEYGKTKLAGEQAILATGAMAYIFRTAWVYSNQGGNFYKTMLRLSESHEQLRVVNDQIGSPTYAFDIADATKQVIDQLLTCDSLEDIQQSFPAGVYHLTNTGKTSWADFASEIFRFNGKQVSVTGIPSSEYPTPAKRPAYSVLDTQSFKDTFNVELRDWKAAFQACAQETQS